MKKAICYKEKWAKFSESSLCFSCAYNSESIVEELLSIQRFIQNDRMSELSTATLKARLQLHKPPNNSWR